MIYKHNLYVTVWSSGDTELRNHPLMLEDVYTYETNILAYCTYTRGILQIDELDLHGELEAKKQAVENTRQNMHVKLHWSIIFRGWGSTCRRGLVGEYVCV